LEESERFHFNSSKFTFDSVAYNPVKTKISYFAMETAYMYFTKEDFTN